MKNFKAAEKGLWEAAWRAMPGGCLPVAGMRSAEGPSSSGEKGKG